MHRTTWSYVAEVRKPGKGVPAAAASRVWLSWDTPHSSYYTVVYGTQNEIPPSWGWGLQCTMSRNSAWWASNVVKNWLDLRYNAMLPDVVAARVRCLPSASSRLAPSAPPACDNTVPFGRKSLRRMGWDYDYCVDCLYVVPHPWLLGVPVPQEELEAEIQQSTAAAEKAALSLEDGTAAGYERSRQYLEVRERRRLPAAVEIKSRGVSAACVWRNVCWWSVHNARRSEQSAGGQSWGSARRFPHSELACVALSPSSADLRGWHGGAGAAQVVGARGPPHGQVLERVRGGHCSTTPRALQFEFCPPSGAAAASLRAT